jgi:Domain of unknown function (DUF4132)
LETQWYGADGRELSGPPAAAKEAHAEELKALRVRVKEIGKTLKTQRLRLERLYLADREWPLDLWRARIPPAVRRQRHSVDDLVEGVPAGGRRQDQGPLDRIADRRLTAGAKLPLGQQIRRGTVHGEWSNGVDRHPCCIARTDILPICAARHGNGAAAESSLCYESLSSLRLRHHFVQLAADGPHRLLLRSGVHHGKACSDTHRSR